MTPTVPLFTRQGDRFEPSVFARGPWDAGLLHGGAVGALAAEVLQRAIDPAYQPARLTVDLIRPVPLAPLDVEVEVLRTGARLAAARTTIAADGKASAVASLVAIRPVPLTGAAGDGLAPPGDDPDRAEARWNLSPDDEAFIGGAMHFRFVAPPDTLQGGVAWLHLHRPVLAGEQPSPLARVAAAADVPSAVSGFDGPRFEGAGFINADISFHLSRPLAGEWVRLTSTSRWEANGVGIVSAVVGDTLGVAGRIGQALILADGLRPG